MMVMMKNFKQLNMCILISVILALNSNNWFMLWMMMEINLLSLLPVIVSSFSSMEIESMIMYLIPNTMASSFILFSNLIMEKTSSMITSNLMFIALLMKMGVFPFHMWMPPIFNMSNWWLISLIMSIQKLTPILIMNSLLFSSFSFIIMLILNAIITGMMGLSQTNMRPLMCYSSLHHTSWILITTPNFKDSSLFYLIMYLPLIFIISSVMMKSKSSLSMQFNFNSSLPYTMLMVSFLTFISLAGIPPMSGFLPKLIILWDLINFTPISASFMIMASAPTIFFYIMIFMSMILNQKKSQNFFPLYINLNFLFITLSPLILIFTL